MASITLLEAAKLSESVIKAGVIMSIITVDQFFTQIPMERVVGRTHTYNREKTEAGADFIDVGDSVPSSAATFDQISNPLVRIVGDVNLDALIEVTLGNTNDQLAVQIGLVAKRIGRIWKSKLIDGDNSVSPEEFDGLDNLVTAAQTFEADTVAAGGAALTFELLDELIDLVTAKDGEVDFLLMRDRTRRSLLSLYRGLGGTEPQHVTRVGMNESILAYRGVPVYRNDNIALTASPSPLTAVLAKVYAGCFGEKVGLVGLMPWVVDDLIQISEPFLHPTRDEKIVRVRYIGGLSLYSDKALAIMENISD